MRIVVNSSTPFGFSGYSTVNKNLIPRLNETSHHEFIYYTRSGRYSSRPTTYEGVPVYSPPQAQNPESYLNGLVDHLDADFVLHIMDAWILDQNMRQFDFPAISYAPIDCSPLSPRWYMALKGMYATIPYNEFGKRQIEREELSCRDPIYHGVDLDAFQPRNTKPLEFDVEDPFILSIFKANVGTRANYDNMLEAIRIFLDNNPDAKDDFRIYMHTSKTGPSAYNLEALLGFFDLSEYARFPNQVQYSFGELAPENLSEIYSHSDVILNTTRAEGHGLPITEAMACKTPSIISDGSAMKDVYEDGVLWADTIKKKGGRGEDDGFEMRPRKMAYYCWPDVHSIADKIEYAYNHPDKLEKLGEEGYEWIQQYSWEKIVPKWIDVLNDIEDETMFSDDDFDIDDSVNAVDNLDLPPSKGIGKEGML